MPRVVREYKEAAKNRILETAYRVFSEKGYRLTTMDDIATKLGVSKGTLYLYFNSKEELFKGIYETGPHALEQIFASSFGKGDPLENAKVFFDKMTTQYASNPALDFEVISEASRNAALRKVLLGNYEKYIEATVRLLEQQTNGLVRQFFEPRPLAQSLIALWNGMETLLVVGYLPAEVRKAWAEAFKAIFSSFKQASKRTRVQ
jgi:AcrR family transcriptional regulator